VSRESQSKSENDSSPSRISQMIKIVKLDPKNPSAFTTNNRHFLKQLTRDVPYHYDDIILEDTLDSYSPLNLRNLLIMQNKVLADMILQQEEQEEIPLLESTVDLVKDDSVLDQKCDQEITADQPEPASNDPFPFSDSVASIITDLSENNEPVPTTTTAPVESPNPTPRSSVLEIKQRNAALPSIRVSLPDHLYIPRKSKYRSRENTSRLSKIQINKTEPSSDVTTDLEKIDEDEEKKRLEELEAEEEEEKQKREKELQEELERQRIQFPELTSYEHNLDKEILQLIRNQEFMRKKLKGNLPMSQYHNLVYGKNRNLSIDSSALRFGDKYSKTEQNKVDKKKRQIDFPFIPRDVADEIWKMKALKWLMSDSHHNAEQHEHEDVMRDLLDLALFDVSEEETFRNYHYYMNQNDNENEEERGEADGTPSPHPHDQQSISITSPTDSLDGESFGYDGVVRSHEHRNDALYVSDLSAKSKIPVSVEQTRRRAVVYSLNSGSKSPTSPTSHNKKDANSPGKSSIKMDIIDSTITKHLQLTKNRASIIRKIHSTIVAKHSVDNYIRNHYNPDGPNGVSQIGTIQEEDGTKATVETLAAIPSHQLSSAINSSFASPPARRGSISAIRAKVHEALNSNSGLEALSSNKVTTSNNAKTLEAKIDKYVRNHQVDASPPIESPKAITTVKHERKVTYFNPNLPSSRKSSFTSPRKSSYK
jgi:hypothetical protein